MNDDNTETQLADDIRNTIAIAYGYLWHVNTRDTKVHAARKMLRQMLLSNAGSVEEFSRLQKYGIDQAKLDGCVFNIESGP